MTKAQLVEAVAKKAGIGKKEASAAVEGVIDSVTASLKKGDALTLVGFGSLRVRTRKARKGRDPRSGKEIKIPACKVIKFTAGKDLKDTVNKVKSVAKPAKKAAKPAAKKVAKKVAKPAAKKVAKKVAKPAAKKVAKKVVAKKAAKPAAKKVAKKATVTKLAKPVKLHAVKSAKTVKRPKHAKTLKAAVHH